ncbi:inorganic phosphate transporter [Chroococcidiopsis sp. CCNUC1]|jgi:inorganic phosphate transporter, PiT family|uniref:inorganic phosphate transporter n=1 Tax=Chroococcidiopsis sp. CCNUC1 TaxID=2653189 RepID=UPI002021C920|nr:inorganic phosphate transporter [Chroococcidiopsis sp. CCNUC1]URD52225.1 inorganic phosphate transporter [Chroococcidiopsis sp. CCNUC1]
MILFLVALLSFYVAWNLGANDVANAMGTSVGSKAVTLRQALVIAGTLEFTGAVLFGHEVSETLATKIFNPALFISQPEVLLVGMISVLLAGGAWLQIATSQGLPVSSSHAIVGAIAGFSACAIGWEAIDWASIGKITFAWVITPIVSGAIASAFYSQVRRWILTQPDPLKQLDEWIPWLSVASIGIFGVIVLPTVSHPIYTLLTQHWGLQLPPRDLPLGLGAIASVCLSIYGWRQLAKSKVQSQKLALEQSEGSKVVPTPDSLVEKQLARFQLLSACFVAFAHGSNDVGNAIAPLAAISYIIRTASVPVDGIAIPLWILVLGGAGIVAGLAVWGKKVIATIGEGIIPLQPSGGFCAELATATTILLASRLGLPVSTSHALVGGVVGVGLVRNWKTIQFQTVRGIAAAWIITVPISAVLGASIFAIARLIFL